jgi:hypothetical protein
MRAMQVVAQDTDAVRMQFLAALLRDAGVEAVLLDAQAASLGLGIVAQRLAVRAEDAALARRLLADADALG